jgi:hypothetical protein
VEKLIAFVDSGVLTPDMVNRDYYLKDGAEHKWDRATCKMWAMACGLPSSLCQSLRLDDYREFFKEITPEADHCLSKVFAHIRGYTGGVILLSTPDLVTIGLMNTIHAEAPPDAVDMYFGLKHLPLDYTTDDICLQLR